MVPENRCLKSVPRHPHRRAVSLAALAALLLLPALPAAALGPHECAIIVNRRSLRSLELANAYAALRQIPPVNIIHLDLPDEVREAGASLSPAEFQRLIYEPVQKTLRERNIAGHILAWLYSADFPSVITTDPPMSLTGITLVRGQPPEAARINEGTWISPLFQGPDRADGPAAPPTSLENFTLKLGTNMPVPSMLLGWTGSRGMPVAAIREQLASSATADAAQPSASVYFELKDDPRSQARQWQFAPATRELLTLGVAAFTASNPPAARPDLMGILGGRAGVHPHAYGAVRPGAYADHLTSFAGRFDDPDQSKLTVWLRHGAAGSSGTVTEPFANWAKFPSARLFTHYASGCSLLESLYQATRSPLQILMVGDALCAPWAKPPGLTLVNMAEDETQPLSGRAEFLASTWGGFGQRAPVILFFLDGRPVNNPANSPQLTFDTTPLHDGYHELRVVAYAQETVRHQSFDTKPFISRNRGRSCSIGGYEQGQRVDLYRPLTFTITASGTPQEAALVCQERVIARGAYSNGMTLTVHPLQGIGAGPVAFQAVVVYDGKEPVRSEPLRLDIAALNRPPVVNAITATDEGETRRWRITTSDPDADPVQTHWYLDLLAAGEEPRPAPPEGTAVITRDGTALRLAATNGTALVTFAPDQPNRIRELRATVRLEGNGHPIAADEAGLVFNALDDQNYLYWGLDGRRCAWVLNRVRDGVVEPILSRGDAIDNGQPHSLMILALGTQEVALFANDELQARAPVSFSAGRVGLRTGTRPVQADHLLVSPPSAARMRLIEEEQDLRVAEAEAPLIPALRGAARDQQFTAIKPLRAE